MSDLAAMARQHLSTMTGHLTLRQIAMLGLICDDPDAGSTGEIATKLGLAKPVVTRAIRMFELLGLATSRRNPSDGRLKIITPTQRGIQLRASFRGEVA
ncbi:MarR family transcriptional regulator [Sphingomonas oryzagri]